MKAKLVLAAYLASLAMFASFAFSSAADCRGQNQFNGGHSGPPKTSQNVCTK